MMVAKTLYLAWQDTQDENGHAANRQWFPVGRLDVDAGNYPYRFRYTRGAEEAQQVAGFIPLPEFPDFKGDYRATELFPLFQNRIISPKRPDFDAYLRVLNLDKYADPIEILSANGGRRQTDNFEVFPKLVKDADGSFVCRFFLHGWRYVSQAAQTRLDSLKQGENLYVALELTNPITKRAVQLQTDDYHMIGWAPRYLVNDLTEALMESPGKYAASVVRVNPQPAPSRQRVLVEMRSYWDRHEPMTGTDFQPLVA